ncbi:MAG: hypothetical protein RSE46_09000 [Janthinobacterium sp.]
MEKIVAKKIVYQVADDGAYLGNIEAEESPLEPGVFLIPAGAVELKPMNCKAGFQPVFLDGKWEAVPTAPPPSETPDNAQARANAAILADIVYIEQTRQPRALRDFILNGDSSFLKSVDDDIQALRARLSVSTAAL